jgi:hypothetical protein
MFTPTRQDLIRQKVNLISYLPLLSQIVRRTLNVHELCSLEETVSIRHAVQKNVDQTTNIYDCSFADLHSDRFLQFIQRLEQVNPEPVSIWTRQTIDCGTLILPSIAAVLSLDFEVVFKDEALISFWASNLNDKLLLDFELSSNNEKLMTIETQGANWIKVSY